MRKRKSKTFPRAGLEQLLCCLVNLVGECKTCGKKICIDHSIQCDNCGVSCIEHGSALLKCHVCHDEWCGRCMMSGPNKECLCNYCYDERYNNNYDPDNSYCEDYYQP